MNEQTQIAERREQPPLVKLNSQLEDRAAEFKKALPSHISPEKLQRTIMTAAQNNPDILLADRQSLITSCMKAAQDGLLPDGREAALVIFNNRVKGADGQWYTQKIITYMPMAFGLRKKIMQSGDISSLQTGLVYRAELEAGAFIYEIGMEPPIRHRPMLDLPAEEIADDKIVAAYSIARMKDGTVSVEVLRRGEIDRIREASMTGATRDRFGKPREAKGPWADWYGEMARKSVLRRHSKTLPMSGDIIHDIEGREHEAAESAMRALSVQPDAPAILPEPEAFDEQTGELAPPQGMTEVDEETARALDATQAGGDGYDGGSDNGSDDDEAPLWQTHVETAMRGALDAKSLKELKTAEDQWLKHRAGIPEDGPMLAVDDAINAARKELQAAMQAARAEAQQRQ
jgi:recombination protein RecT